MSLIKFSNRNRLFPWNNDGLKSFLSSDDFFNDDFFIEDGIMPAMNIIEHKKDFEIEFAAPGFSKKDFEVTLDENILKVCGEKSHDEEEEKEDYTRREFSYNSFKRTLRLPDNVDSKADVKATYKNGILKLHLSKSDEIKKASKKLIEVA